MAPPRRLSLYCRAGTTLVARVEVTEDGEPVDLTGVVLTLQIAPQPGASPSFEWSTEPVVISAGDGRVDIAVPEEATAQMTGYGGRWEWTLLGTQFGVGTVELASGPLNLAGSLT